MLVDVGVAVGGILPGDGVMLGMKVGDGVSDAVIEGTGDGDIGWYVGIKGVAVQDVSCAGAEVMRTLFEADSVSVSNHIFIGNTSLWQSTEKYVP